MINLSLCMIVKNEEDTLERCLKSAKQIADEIIIVDTGSTDRTKEIAKRFTNNIYDFEWVYDFSKARNYSFSKATKDYIMWLDADDVILDEDIKKIKILKRILTKDIDMVTFKYNLNLDENGVPALSYRRERIFKRSKGYKWIGPIHEVIERTGKVLDEDISITHKKIHKSEPGRNLKIFEKMIEKNILFDARQTFYYARELMYVERFEESIKEYTKFLSMKDAWIENKISAYLDLYDIYLKLNEEDLALSCLFKTFILDTPRAEVCSKIGMYFVKEKKYFIAIYWFNEALTKEFDTHSGGFFIKDYYDFIPLIELGLCYYYLGDIKKANEYNEKAGKIKPNDKSYLNNKNFYLGILNKTHG